MSPFAIRRASEVLSKQNHSLHLKPTPTDLSLSLSQTDSLKPKSANTEENMRMAVMIFLTFVSIIATTLPHTGAIRFGELKQLASRHNVTCVLVFGDSSVDPGNNNRLRTTFKGNFKPYGEDFINRIPTGRFTNGKLPTDFIAEALGYTAILPGYLEPNVKNEQLLHGVSFASAASGYDDLTANLTNVLPLWKQLEYLKHYKIRLSGLVGQNRAQEVIRNAIFVLSMGTNDFIQNYFLQPFRPKQFTVAQYEDFLVAKMVQDIKEMNRVGATRLVIVGLTPLGCMPLVKTLMGETKCVDSYNKAAFSFNSKVQVAMAKIKASLGMKTAFVDTYGIIERAMKNPSLYGFTETTKGCCGSGIIEFGDTCKGMDTCKDRSKYIFWDAVHPTEKMYKIIADEATKSAVMAKIFA